MAQQATLTKERKAKKIGVGKIIGLFFAVLLTAAAVLFLIMTHNWRDTPVEYDTTNAYITKLGETMVSAHRSGGGIFPENTMMAFEGCINSESFKTDIYEFDLHITKDGELILLHDDTLDRTSNSEELFGVKNAKPEDYSYEELRRLNFGENFTAADGSTPYKGLRGEAVPENLKAAKLEDVLDYLEANGGFSYIIEIKNGGELGRRAADKLYAILNGKGLLKKVIAGTFKQEITEYFDEKYPDMLRSAGIKEVLGFYFDSLTGREREKGFYKFDALQIPSNQYVIKLGTARLINFAHKNDIAVQYWTINDAEEIRRLQEIGADCVMSDVPDLAYSTINE